MLPTGLSCTWNAENVAFFSVPFSTAQWQTQSSFRRFKTAGGLLPLAPIFKTHGASLPMAGLLPRWRLTACCVITAGERPFYGRFGASNWQALSFKRGCPQILEIETAVLRPLWPRGTCSDSFACLTGSTLERSDKLICSQASSRSYCSNHQALTRSIKKQRARNLCGCFALNLNYQAFPTTYRLSSF